MNIEVQFTNDCANAAPILQRVKRIAHERSDLTLKLTLVGNDERMPEGFAGSPTVRVNGRNLSGGAAVDGAACALRPRLRTRSNRPCVHTPRARNDRRCFAHQTHLA